jgi:hypothetical protein
MFAIINVYWRELIFIAAPLLFFGAFTITDFLSSIFSSYQLAPYISSSIIIFSLACSLYAAFSYNWYLNRKRASEYPRMITLVYYSGVIPLFFMAFALIFGAGAGK